MGPRGPAPLAPLIEDLDALAEAVRRPLAVRAAADISAQDLDTPLDVLRAIEGAVAALNAQVGDPTAATDTARQP